MSKKDEDAKRRKAQKKKKAENKERERSVKFERDGKTMIIRQGGNAYDVKMIRDFFDHLMIELKCRHDEALAVVESLDAGDTWQTAYEKSRTIVSPVDDEVFQKYLRKYQCALLYTNSIDTNGASEEEIAVFLHAHRTIQIEESKRMMECLKQMEEQLDESLLCAKMPFGRLEDGVRAAPVNSIRVMDHIEMIRRTIERRYEPGDEEE